MNNTRRQRPAPRGRLMEIAIYRDGLSSPWGFRLHGGVDLDSPLTVQKVTPLSAADGYLRRGDIITKIDSYDATNLTHDAALNLICSAGSCVKLTLLRPNQDSLDACNNLTDSFSDMRVRFADDWSLLNKQPPYTGQPKTRGNLFAAVSSPKVNRRLERGLSADENEVEVKRAAAEQAKKLAGIMKASLPDVQNRRAVIQRKLSDSSQSSYSRPTTDITAYLPHCPPRRAFPASSTTVEQNLKHQLKDTLTSGVSVSPTGFGGSGRSTPSTSSAVIELGSPVDRHAKPMGVWTPPTHQPQAKLVHLQYNSPMDLYSAHNVVDSVEKMTGSKVDWLNSPPSTKYLDDIRESATYKFVQELEGRRPTTSQGKVFEQSTTMKNMARYFAVDFDQ